MGLQLFGIIKKYIYLKRVEIKIIIITIIEMTKWMILKFIVS